MKQFFYFSKSYIKTFAKGRDNNFNLLRMIGAVVVVIAHGFNIKSGVVESENSFENAIYLTGFRALDLFFVFSGFLVTASLINRQDSIKFWVARVLRIFPALILVSIVIVVTIGPINTALPFNTYLFNSQTWLYPLVTGLTTYPDWRLPGVFHDLPVSEAVNVPIWTLRYEFILYFALFASSLLGVLKDKRLFAAGLAVLLFTYLYLTISTSLRENIVFADHLSHFTISFAYGSAIWMFRDRIPLSRLLICGLWLIAFVVRNTAFLEISTIIAVGYTYFWLAYIPSGAVRRYNKLGDYSYGLYVIHWPIGQTLLTHFPEMPPLEIGLISLVVGLPLAIASWHLLERPALSQIDSLAANIRRRISCFQPKGLK